jgi:hypothetical protein
MLESHIGGRIFCQKFVKIMEEHNKKDPKILKTLRDTAFERVVAFVRLVCWWVTDGKPRTTTFPSE